MKISVDASDINSLFAADGRSNSDQKFE